jgi:uncharacterized protein YheU (UPF0270 family)
MDEPRGVEVPCSALSEETLAGVIEEFVTRAGTDYGAVERTLAEKIADVRRQLARGEATIVFDPETATIDIVAAGPRPRGPQRKDP